MDHQIWSQVKENQRRLGYLMKEKSLMLLEHYLSNSRYFIVRHVYTLINLNNLHIYIVNSEWLRSNVLGTPKIFSNLMQLHLHVNFRGYYISSHFIVIWL